MFFNNSPHISLYKECYSHIPLFSVFSPYSRSFSVNFSFFTFFIDFVIFQVVKCVFLIFHDFQFSRHIPCTTVDIHIFQLFQFSSPYFTSYSVCFSFSTFSVILPYSRSYSVHLPFFMFFNISRHILLPKECYSHFP